jgi:hypothetical protein
MAGMSELAAWATGERRKNMAKASVAGGDLIDGYLGELRRRLEVGMVRNSGERAAQVAAEAEDHLREATAVSVAAGMSEQDAQRAAIAAFGDARTVARAHRPRAVAVLATVATALCALLGTYTLVATVAGGVVGFWASFAASDLGAMTVPSHGDASASAMSGNETLLSRLTAGGYDPAGYAASFGLIALIGIALLAAYFIVRRRRRANGGAARVVPLPGLFYPVAAAGMPLLGLVELAAPLHGFLPVPLGHLKGSYELGMGAVIACAVMCLVYVEWSAVLLVRWIAARVKASRQPLGRARAARA